MMTIFQNPTTTEDQPLTRADVEQILREVGSPEKLNLSGRNLNGIDLLAFDLTGANLSGANLGGAILRESILSRANLRQADLRQADLVKAKLIGADLQDANLYGASVGLADLSKADLSRANLTTANLSSANLSGANLRDSNLTFAMMGNVNLSGAYLSGANLSNTGLTESDLSGAYLSEAERKHLGETGGQVLEELHSKIPEQSPTFRILVVEEPLTAHNLTLIISNLTELTTKFWLIAKGRFADLVEYTQTHNDEFAKEAHTIVSSITHNSPLNMDWKVDVSVPGVAEAIVTVIDGIAQAGKRFEKADLEVEAKRQEIKQAEQKSEQEQRVASIAEETLLLEMELHRLEVLEKRLEVQKKGIEYALEIASKVVDTLHPAADAATRAMEIQTLLPNLVQLQNGKGLELELTATQKVRSVLPKEE